MKKSLATFLTIVLLLALAVPVLAEPEIVPFEFARTKTVKNVSGSEKVIIDDPNTKKDTDITCSWKSSSGPTKVKVKCYIWWNGGWAYYSQKELSLSQTFSTHISGGERFKLTVTKTQGSNGDCKFGVRLV